MRHPAATLAVLLVAVSMRVLADSQTPGLRSTDQRPDLPATDVRSGLNFLTAETRALQEDSFANPGYLWVDRGQELFALAPIDRVVGEPAGSDSQRNGKACASCHAESGDRPLQGSASHYPQLDASTGRLLNLEGRINQCRVKHQLLAPLAYESEDLLGLTAYVASLSRGMPLAVTIDDSTQTYFDAGRDYFFRRRGQLNLACNQCHDDNWGRMLRGDRISQGHPNAWPGYRLEWQTFGSLHRRLQDCDAGVRAEPHAGGSEIYTSLELYLAWRARGLTMESPGVRR